MNLLDLISAYAITAGAVHPHGHVAEGYRNDVPMRIDYRSGTEKLSKQMPDRMTATQIHGAGFEAQDDIKNAMADPKAKSEMSIANALYKALYLSGIPDKFAKGMDQGGDIGAMEKTSGNNHLREILTASMLADLIAYKYPNKNWDVGFSTFGTGQPGLKLNVKF